MPFLPLRLRPRISGMSQEKTRKPLILAGFSIGLSDRNF
jgi:hypothetical protein